MSHETSKAVRRRFLEDRTFWDKIFQGHGLDVGSGDDPHPFAIDFFDKENGDAQTLSQYYPAKAFDWIHASQLVEHLVDPYLALRDWYVLLNKNGHIVFTVPDWCLYEGMVWPSRWNPDHKSTWSLWMKDSPAPIHMYVPRLLESLSDLYICVRHGLVDTNYNYKVGTQRDQTQQEEVGVEAFIEIVLRKK